MSGPLPKQQKSRSPKGKDQTAEAFAKLDKQDDLDTISKQEAANIFKWDGIEPDCTTEQNGDGSEDEGEHDEYS
jgi:hypothetical protein